MVIDASHVFLFSYLALHREYLVSFPCTILIVAWHLSLRVDVTSEAVYELVTEPKQEPQAREPQAEVAAEHATEEVANPADLQGKPRSITHKFSILIFFTYLCIYVLGVVWNPSMHVFPWDLRVYTSVQISLAMLC